MSNERLLDGVVMWMQRVSTNDINEPAFSELLKVMRPYIVEKGYAFSGLLAHWGSLAAASGGTVDGF